MIKTLNIVKLILIVGAITLNACKSSSKSINTAPTINSKVSEKKPYVLLISLDGFRWDYIDTYKPPNMSNFIKNGVNATSLIPSFPSKTFPNHYTIATGMYPDKHGIIGNSFYSNKKDMTYSIRKREMVEDGSFYGGSPIWIEAAKANMVSASYFFVGTEANIQGMHPTYYHPYDGKIKNDIRVTEVLNWLNLPEKTRPHLLTMYFSDIDNVGHKYGPNNDEKLKKAIFDLDRNLGDLFEGIKATKLPVNIIIVSDHGMTAVPISKFIPIETIENKALFRAIDNGAIVNIHPKKGVEIDTIIRYLKTKEINFKVHKTEHTPGFEYRPKNKDWGAVQIIPDFGYYFSSQRGIDFRREGASEEYGVHGYDPKYKDMHGIFYANGPAFKNGYAIESIKNIHIFPLMCEILGLNIPNDIDGDLDMIESVLKSD